MRRVVVLLAVAGGLAAVFTTASRGPSTTAVVEEAGRLVVVAFNDGGCSFAQSPLQLPGPIVLDCRTHREAERLEASFRRQAQLGAVGSVRGTKVVFP